MRGVILIPLYAVFVLLATPALAHADPISLGILGGLSMVGGGLSAFGAISGALAQNEMAKAQAASEKAKGEAKVYELAQEKKRLIASQIAAAGGAGVNPQYGTPAALVGDTAFQTAFEQHLVRTGASTNAAIIRAGGRAQLISGVLGAAGGLLTSAVRSYDTSTGTGSTG